MPFHPMGKNIKDLLAISILLGIDKDIFEANGRVVELTLLNISLLRDRGRYLMGRSILEDKKLQLKPADRRDRD